MGRLVRVDWRARGFGHARHQSVVRFMQAVMLGEVVLEGRFVSLIREGGEWSE
jgi:hypothetical protein